MKRFFFNYLIPILILTGFWACDRINKDELPSPNSAKTLITKPKIPVLQDLTKLHALTQPATFSLVGTPRKGRAEFVKAGLLMYSPNEDTQATTDSVNYQICMDGKCENALLSVKILEQGTEPEPDDICEQGAFGDMASIVLPNNQLIINVLENDTFCLAGADANTLQIAIPPTKGTATVQASKVVYQINPNDFTGGEIITFVYQVAQQDKPDNVKFAAVVVKIKSENCVLMATPDVVNLVLPNNEIKIKPLANDEFCIIPFEYTDFKITYNPLLGTASLSGDEITYKIDPSQFSGEEEDYIYYQVTEKGYTTYGSIKINIVDGCNLVVNSDEVTFKLPNNQLTINVLENDVFCNTPREFTNFQISSPPSKGTATINGDKIIYQINPAEFTGNEIMYIGYQVAEKNRPNKIFQTYVQINFEPANCDLIVRDDAINVQINGGFESNVWNNDSFCKQSLHADTLEAFKIISPPAHGKIYKRFFQNGNYYGYLSYGADLDYEGDDQFTYQLKYKDGTAKQGIVKVKIAGGTKCIDTPLQAQNDTYTFRNVDLVQNSASKAYISFWENDTYCTPAVDFEKTKITQDILSNQGSLSLQNNEWWWNAITYTLPSPTFTGTVVFKYQICDKYNRCSEATVTLNITN